MGTQLAAWEDFETEIHSRQDTLATMFPTNISKERFSNVAISAVKQTPELLQAGTRSLFSAITKAAQDGLLPDGREGVITLYNCKVTVNGTDTWEKRAQWNPMVYGLRKRARDLDGILIDAQVVYANDTFVWHQGDDPRIEHVPAPLGKPRGEMLGAYAIFKREDGTILHREVMDKSQIEATRAQSRAKDSLMWTKFVTEGWRKSVIRRGIKSVPCSDKLEALVHREDETFDFDASQVVRLTPPPAPKLVISRGSQPSPPKAPVSSPAHSAPTNGQSAALPGDWPDYLDRQRDECMSAPEPSMKQAVTEAVTDTITGAQERGDISGEEAELIAEAWNDICAKADQ